MTPDLVIEWSSRGYTAYDGRTGTTRNSLDGLSGREAVLALGRRSVFVRTTRLPNVSYAENRQILLIRADELFPLSLKELAFDFTLTEDTADGGHLALVVAASATDIRSAMAQLATAGIKVRRVVPASLGSALLAAKAGMREAAVVQPADEGIAIDIISSGVACYSRIVPVGPNLEADVCRTFTIAGIPCAPTIAAGPNAWVGADRQVSTSSLAAIAEHPGGTLNLRLPETVAAEESRQKSQKMRTALLMAAAAGALALYVYSDYDDAAAKVRAEDAKYGRQLRKLQSIQKVAEADAVKLTDFENELRRGYAPAQAFGDIFTTASDKLPDGVWLTGISLERGKELQLRGIAKTSGAVANYVRLLAAQPRLRNVRLVFANNSNIDKIPVTQFSVSAFPVGNLPILMQSKRSRS